MNCPKCGNQVPKDHHKVVEDRPGKQVSVAFCIDCQIGWDEVITYGPEAIRRIVTTKDLDSHAEEQAR